jgi:hypothetical protein
MGSIRRTEVTAFRGGYGIFYEHMNGNEANTDSLRTLRQQDSALFDRHQ